MRHLYTDGSSLGNPGPGGWGYVLLDEVKKIKIEGSGGVPDTTNNRMELQAVIEGLKQLLKRHEITVSTATIDQGLGMFGEASAGKLGGIFDGDVVIFTDSTYVKQGITEWIDTWIKRDWRLSKGGKLVKNVDLWQELYAVVGQFEKLDWQWVKAHVGNKWNERVDDLARGAAEEL